MSIGRVLFCKFSNPSPQLVPPGSAARPGRSLLSAAVLLAVTGCSELQARHHAREGNDLFRAGDYAGAVREYETAEEIFPAGLHVIELNKGLACRQLMVPGGKGPEQDRTV